MSSLNRVAIIGRLGQDPELRFTKSNTAVATLSVATSERYKDKEGVQQEKTEEIWKDIDGFNGKYMVSDKGRVKSFAYGRERMMSLREKKNGYLRVTLYQNRHFYRYVHRLVAEAFIGGTDGMQIDHLDNNKKNNQLENLEVVTQRENLRRQKADGLIAKGEDYNRALTNNQVIEIKRLLRETNLTHREIAEKFGVHRVSVSYIHQNKTWRHIDGLTK